MLKLGEKGAIPQKDRTTYAIAPHIPCGVVTPDLLRKLANIAEKYNVQAMKITGATRIALIGLKEEDIDTIWDELEMDKGAAVGLCVRSIRACPGTTFCSIGKQDALGMGMKLDTLYHAVQLPGKFKMAVSGCKINCAESSVRDFGLIGEADGWKVVVGGNVGVNPRIADEVAKGLNDEQVLDCSRKVIAYYTENAAKGERIGKTIERVGLDALKAALSGSE
jgi:NAD(P)H-nitrite reductase large subunit